MRLQEAGKNSETLSGQWHGQKHGCGMGIARAKARCFPDSSPVVSRELERRKSERFFKSFLCKFVSALQPQTWDAQKAAQK